jgi:hypothetical protein
VREAARIAAGSMHAATIDESLNDHFFGFNFHRLACWTCMKHFMKVGYLFSG